MFHDKNSWAKLNVAPEAAFWSDLTGYVELLSLAYWIRDSEKLPTATIEKE